MKIPHGGDKQKKYRVFCVKCGKRRTVEGGNLARMLVRIHNQADHNGYPVAAYESEL